MPTNSVLCRTKNVVLGVSECDQVDTGDVVEETQKHHALVFPLAGVFSIDTGPTTAAAVPSKLLFFSEGQTHQVIHPYGGKDRSAYVTLSPDLVEPFVEVDGRFRRLETAPPPRLAHEILRFLHCANGGTLSHLELEEFALYLLAACADDERPDTGYSKRQRDVIADAETYLAIHYRQDCQLTQVARSVGTSPHHLSRLFKAITGESLTRRRTRLRLQYALQQILSGTEDLSRVAVEAGFYDHAHLTNSFRSHLGLSPSDARRHARESMSSRSMNGLR